MSLNEHLGPQNMPVKQIKSMPVHTGESITIDRQTFTFVSGKPGPYEIQIGRTQEETRRNINTALGYEAVQPNPKPKKKKRLRLIPVVLATQALKLCRDYAHGDRGNVVKLAAKVSELTGEKVSHQSISRWLNGDQEPKLGNALVLLLAADELHNDAPLGTGETRLEIWLNL